MCFWLNINNDSVEGSPRCRIAESKCICIFSFSKRCPTGVQSVCKKWVDASPFSFTFSPNLGISSILYFSHLCVFVVIFTLDIFYAFFVCVFPRWLKKVNSFSNIYSYMDYIFCEVHVQVFCAIILDFLCSPYWFSIRTLLYEFLI